MWIIQHRWMTYDPMNLSQHLWRTILWILLQLFQHISAIYPPSIYQIPHWNVIFDNSLILSTCCIEITLHWQGLVHLPIISNSCSLQYLKTVALYFHNANSSHRFGPQSNLLSLRRTNQFCQYIHAMIIPFLVNHICPLWKATATSPKVIRGRVK